MTLHLDAVSGGGGGGGGELEGLGGWGGWGVGGEEVGGLILWEKKGGWKLGYFFIVF